MEDIIIGVYRIRNIQNNKCYYGSSKNIHRRFNGHKMQLNSNKHHNCILQKSWNKYGASQFVFEIVELCAKNVLLLTEQKYLDLNKNGYNIGKTASGGDNLTNNPNREIIISKIKKSINNRNNSLSIDERKERFSKPGELNPNFNKGYVKAWKEKYGDELAAEMLNKYKNAKKGKPPVNKGLKLEDYIDSEKVLKIKSKLSEAAKLRTGKNNPFYGKQHSEESKNKIKLYIKNNRPIGWLPGNARKIEIDGIIYDSLKSASLSVGYSCATCIKKLKSDKYPTWKYLN